MLITVAGIRFTSPIVANGKVYISTGHNLPSTANPQGELDVYAFFHQRVGRGSTVA